MVITMLVTQHKAPMAPATTARHPIPPGEDPPKDHMVIPYVQSLGETIKHTCSRYGIQTLFKGNNTLKQILVKPKDKDPKEKKSGVIYCYQCAAIDLGKSISVKDPGPWGRGTKNT